MLCRKKFIVKDEDSDDERRASSSVPVYLNVYDLTPFNVYAYWLGLGVFHSGVQVHGVEYAFGAHEYPTTGIFEAEPKQCEGFTFRKSILIGKTDLSPAQVRGVMEELAEEYKGIAYNLITKNCNHFCNDACARLTGNPIPSWVNRLARIGFFCNCVLPVTLNTTKVRHHNINGDKPDEAEKKKSTSESNTATSSSKTSSSASSSPLITRGRSRTKRPPASPLIIRSISSPS